MASTNKAPVTPRPARLAATSYDTIAGASVRTLPFTESGLSLDELTNPDDIFAVYLTAGQTISVQLTASPSNDYELYLFPPGTTTVVNPSAAVDWSEGSVSDESLLYTARVTGYYYIDAYAWAGTGPYTLSASLATPDPDGNVPGIPALLPFTVSGDANQWNDVNDVYSFYATAGQTITAALSGAVDTDLNLYLYRPGTTTLNDTSKVLAGSAASGTTTESITCIAPVSGTYFLDVYAMPNGGGTDYVLSASAANTPTSVNIKTSATTTYIGKTPMLTGTVTPTGMIGVNMVVYVKKPGKAYWTYSSNRTVYALNGGAAWQYKYYFKKGMAKGIYYFKAVTPAPGFANGAGFDRAESGVVSIRVK